MLHTRWTICLILKLIQTVHTVTECLQNSGSAGDSSVLVKFHWVFDLPNVVVNLAFYLFVVVVFFLAVVWKALSV